ASSGSLARRLMRSLLSSTESDGSVKIHSSDVPARSPAPTAVHTARRSSRYVDCLAKLDAPDLKELDTADIVQAVEAEFGLGETVPLGCVAKCYLGAPYQVHI